MDSYLALAAELKDELTKARGFVRSERFSSIFNGEKLLSLSVWESEEDIMQWRNQYGHRISQRQGRDAIFESYSITVTSTIRCYSKEQRTESPSDSNKYFGCIV